MLIKLNRELNPIKNGWRSRCPQLGLVAHGFSPEVADKNLERVVRLFLAPFQREGTLSAEVQGLGLKTESTGEQDLEITLSD